MDQWLNEITFRWKKGTGGKTIRLSVMSCSFWTSKDQAGIVCLWRHLTANSAHWYSCGNHLMNAFGIAFPLVLSLMNMNEIHMCFEFVCKSVWSTQATNKLTQECILSCCYWRCSGPCGSSLSMVLFCTLNILMSFISNNHATVGNSCHDYPGKMIAIQKWSLYSPKYT